jgi:hypothetical protein
MEQVIVYYVVSPVHVYNAKLLSSELGGWTLRLAYEKISSWLDDDRLKDCPFETWAFGPEDIPDALWRGNVGAVVFSTLQPRGGPLELLVAAMEREIPTVAVEESNQIALNRGAVNNYILPVDKVLTASEHERRGMVAAGFPAARFEATGWPFYGGRLGKLSEKSKAEKKRALGLAPDRPVAALTLTGLNDAGESPAVRERQLTLAAVGLPDNYQLVIKPHPIEPLDSLMPFVEKYAPRAEVVEGIVRIEELLAATDVLLNRGVSQVCLEALFQEIPVIVLDTGVQTPFHGLVDEFVVSEAAELEPALALIVGDKGTLDKYKPFFVEHVALPPAEARSRTCEVIAEMARGGVRGLDRSGQWFDLALYLAWAGDRRGAETALVRSAMRENDLPIAEIRCLLELRAGRADIEALKKYYGEGFRADFLRGLWVDQLRGRRTKPEQADLDWMESFPPETQTVWFVKKAREWAFYLVDMGHGDLAGRFTQAVNDQHLHVPGVARLRADCDTYRGSVIGRAKITLQDMMIGLLGSLRPKVANMRRLGIRRGRR